MKQQECCIEKKTHCAYDQYVYTNQKGIEYFKLRCDKSSLTWRKYIRNREAAMQPSSVKPSVKHTT